VVWAVRGFGVCFIDGHGGRAPAASGGSIAIRQRGSRIRQHAANRTGSIVAFLCGTFVNSYVLAKMKIWTKGRWLWTRIIGSTVCGELVDSVIFYFVAFYEECRPRTWSRSCLRNMP